MARAVSLLWEKHRKRQHVLCLPPATGDLPDTGGLIISSPALPVRKPIEHAGHPYQERVIRLYAVNQPTDDTSPTGSPNSKKAADDNSSSSSNAPQPTSEETASTLASKMAIGSDDLYELLELGDKRWHASADDIKKNFRRLSLRYHPDKIAHMGEEARQNSESHFKSVMKAYDILSDKKKRAAYDSIDDADDSIPTERDGNMAAASPERFYAKFAECFELNARWSIHNRVPRFGDDSTDMAEVEAFYEFWYSFKSWRDFSFDLEYNTDQAECREEKRWMERQNSKHVKQKKLEESSRIRKLVDLAHKYDPRLVRQRNELKAKKNKQKEEKRKLQEEKLRIEKEREENERIEKERKEQDDKEKRAAAKKQKENARQVMRKTRQKLRSISKRFDLISDEKGGFNVEKMCMEGSVESIDAVSDNIAALKDQMNIQNESDKRLRASALSILEKAVINPREPLASVSPTDGEAPSSPASTQEPQKASNDSQPPSETPQASSPLAETNGHTKSNGKDERAKQSTSSSAGKSNTAWTADELSILSKGVAKFPGGTRDRWQKLSDMIGTKTPEEVLKKVNESRVSKMNSNNVAVQPGYSAKKEEAKAFERYQEKKKGATSKPSAGTATTSTTSTTPTSSSATTSSAPSTGGAATKPAAKAASRSQQPPNKLQFTPKEQTLFESALKKFPISEGDNRWKKVSNTVGRTPDECQQRFKELITFFQARKGKQ